MEMNSSVAVLITCHNRKNVTLGCIQRLVLLKPDADVYIVDDSSTDGTPEAITKLYPHIVVIHGNGDLFWCRGMNLAWKTAKEKKDYEYYIWLNDDLYLYNNAFDELFECSIENNNKAIISGIVEGELTHKAVYGGYDKKKHLIEPSGGMEKIINLNGNFVLIPKYVRDKVGFFDEVYHHDIGDVDYGLSALRQGVNVFTTRCFIGSTKESLKLNELRIRKSGTNIKGRFKRLYSPLGSNPVISFYFFKKNYGIIKAFSYCIFLIFINLLPDTFFYRLFPKYKQC